jgi:hypothetical protein
MNIPTLIFLFAFGLSTVHGQNIFAAKDYLDGARQCSQDQPCQICEGMRIRFWTWIQA